ncbi:MAG: hypothetical protein HQK51_18505 [Oligoflexia bacterium]|nr:hypothetical protein [Oligoflexia bacterium]
MLGVSNNNVVFFNNDYTKPSNDIDIDPIERYPYPAKMPAFLCKIGLVELQRWERERALRVKLLNNYINVFKQHGLERYLPKCYFDETLNMAPLRFVFYGENFYKLQNLLKKYIDLNWTWFKSPIICCPDDIHNLGYNQGECPVSEEIGKTIINLPCNLQEEWHNVAVNILDSCIRKSILK